MPKLDVTDDMVRPYQWLGVNITGGTDKDASGDCPFCGREGRLGIHRETGKWQCFVCSAGGNLTTFLRQLHEVSSAQTQDYDDLLAERPPLEVDALIYWESAKSILDDCWLFPGYNHEGKLCTLYKWSQPVGSPKKRLQLPPGCEHYPSGLGAAWDPLQDLVWVVEGLWDGAAWWQTLRRIKDQGNVLSVPGVKLFKEAWTPILAGKHVILVPDSDHPREYPKGSGNISVAGWDGIRRTAGILSSSESPPKSIKVVQWGEGGYDKNKPSGWDLRDALSEGLDLDEVFAQVSSKVVSVPKEWLAAKRQGKTKTVEPKSCKDWSTLTTAWSNALRWRQGLEDVLAVMLSVCLSTEQVGDQLFLQVIGDPGSAKTRLCDGLLVSRRCHALEHMTGFHSGWSDGSGKDFSLISRINGKTLITPEGDVLMSSPRFIEIMSQQRRIFDGTSGASYKNKAEDLRWTGLRTPWIMAGTPALMETDQSRLGDRFLRICIDQPTANERRAIMAKVIETSIKTVCQQSNGHIDSHTEERIHDACRLTGGYVDYLRANAEELLASVRVDVPDLVERFSILAEFAADLRARPHPDHKKDVEHSKELPSRLASQLVRLAMCLAAVTQRWRIDEEIVRIVTKVAIDTAKGKTLRIAEHLYRAGRSGSSLGVVAIGARITEDRAKSLLVFMRDLDMVERFTEGKPGQRQMVKHRLTARLRSLYDEVMANA